MASDSAVTVLKENRLPLFQFCGAFSGKYGESGSAWIKKFEYEHRSHLPNKCAIPPKAYFDTIKMLLVDRAAAWARFALGISALLEKENPEQDEVDYFKQRFITEYPDPSSLAVVIPQQYAEEIESMTQEPSETLNQFYARVKRRLWPLIGLCRKFPSKYKRSSMETAVLELGKKAFAYGIWDQDFRRTAYIAQYIPEMPLDEMLDYIRDFTSTE